MSNKFLDSLQKWQPESGESQQFPMLRINEGTYKIRILDEEPTCRNVHFGAIGKKPVICPGRDCLFCAKGDQPTLRFYSNVVDRADNKVKVMVYSAGLVGRPDHSDGLVGLLTVAGDPRYYDITIVRTGKDRSSTRYQIGKAGEKTTPEQVTTFDLGELLKPMPVEEQIRHLGQRSAATSKKIRELSNPDMVSSVQADAAELVPIADSDTPL